MKNPLTHQVVLLFGNLSLMVKSYYGIKFAFIKEKGGNYEYDTGNDHSKEWY
jgi:hypothetical protein